MPNNEEDNNMLVFQFFHHQLTMINKQLFEDY